MMLRFLGLYVAATRKIFQSCMFSVGSCIFSLNTESLLVFRTEKYDKFQRQMDAFCAPLGQCFDMGSGIFGK